MPVSDAPPEFHRRELRAVLDEELHRLPAKYRDPIVLCYLEGKTNAEAAAQLGWPAGTVFTRLSRGRDLLRDRLKRRGMTLSMVALTAGLIAEAAEGAVPALLAVSTLQAVSAAAAGGGILAASPAGMLAQEFLRNFFWRRVGRLAAVLVLLLAGTGLATGLARAAVAEPKPVFSPLPTWLAGMTAGCLRRRVPRWRLIASGSEDRTARLWSLPTGRNSPLEGHRKMVGPVAFSPNGRLLASGSADREVILWDARTGQPLARSPGHVASVRCLAFSTDGRRLASAGEDATVILHDAATAADQFHLIAGSTVWTLVFSADGSRLAAGVGSAILIWNLEGDRKPIRLTGHRAAVQALLFRPGSAGRSSREARTVPFASGKSPLPARSVASRTSGGR